MKKKGNYFVTVIIICILCFGFCEHSYAAANKSKAFIAYHSNSEKGASKKASIKLNKSKATIYTSGKTSIQLKATVKGAGKKVRWKTSNKAIAVVDSKGKVTAKKAGRVTITAKVKDAKAKCQIMVKKPSIKLNKSKVTLNASDNNTVQLSATVKGAHSKIKWKSSNPLVAEVNAKGKVEAKKAGNATITAKCNGVTARCKVTVKQNTVSLSQVTNVLENYLLKQNIRFYISTSEKIGSSYEIWISYTGPGTKAKYVVDIKSGKVYEYAPYWGIDLPFSDEEPEGVYKFNVQDYL